MEIILKIKICPCTVGPSVTCLQKKDYNCQADLSSIYFLSGLGIFTNKVSNKETNKFMAEI